MELVIVISSIFVVVIVMVTVYLKSALHLHGQSPQPRILQAKLKCQVGSAFLDGLSSSGTAPCDLVLCLWFLQLPAPSCAVGTDNILKGRASATAAGKARSVMCP